MNKILVIGASGQLGSELTIGLRKKYGNENVIASDIKPPIGDLANGPFQIIDALDAKLLVSTVKAHRIGEIYNLAAILSAKAEMDPPGAWNLNMRSLLYTLELGREKLISKIFWPSSIAVFGPSTPVKDTPQRTVMDPNTVYGISKRAGELWCDYYYQRYGVDVRSLRYPGLIGYKHAPGGGTTDYAVDIFFHAVENKPFQCFLKADTNLPMMYMEDAVKATIDLMKADENRVKVRSSYNVAAFSVNPAQMAESIRKVLPSFEISYKPDFRQAIADSWPNTIDDRQARADWNWEHSFDLDSMTHAMLKSLQKRMGISDKAT